MYMDMNLGQKLDWVKDSLSSHFSLWNREDLYFPVAQIPSDVQDHFWDIILKYKREGLVEKAYLGYGGLFDTEQKPEVFKKIGEDGKIPSFTYQDGNGKSHTTKLIPTYYIKIDSKKLRQGVTDSLHNTEKGEVEFDAQHRTIHFGKTHYTFQKGRADQSRYNLFKELWKEKRVVRGEKVKSKGMPLQPGTVASRMEMVDGSHGFERNKAAVAKLNALIKNLETNLRRKKIPIRIYKKGGIQIVVGAK